MPIQTVCASCSAKLNVKDELIGKAIKCPKCGARLAVPAVSASVSGATVAVHASQGALPCDSRGTTEPHPSAAAPAEDVGSDRGQDSPPADPAIAPDGEPPATEFLSTPDAEPPATEFLSKPDGEPPATEFLSTPDGEPPASTPDVEPPATEFLSTPDGEPPATEFLSTPDGERSATDYVPTPDAEASATDFLPTQDAEPAPVSPQTQDAGETWSLGGYRILRELGQGGMGAVYEAEDVKLKRRVALKVMRPEIARNQQHRERFLREARAAANVKSDFICPIYRVGEENGVPFIAMPFMKGEPLDAHLRQSVRLPIDEVMRIGKEVAQGLVAAHEAGLVHRDIKPANIWLETQCAGPRRAIILDFGLARKQADNVQITQSGAVLGTPAFMSPEQARGDKHVDARTDLFSLGGVLYALCTGELPFKGDTTMGILMALATHDPTPPHKISATTPRPLSRLIMRLLAKKPEDRPQTAREVYEELVAIETAAAKPADEAFTTQIDPPLPPAASAGASEPRSRGASKTATRRQQRQPVALATYVLFGLIAVGLLGCVVTVAGTAVYYIVFGGGKGPGEPKVVAEEKKAPPEPTGEVPAGWVVVKRPVANYSVAMPQQPEALQGQNVGKAVKLPNGTQLATFAQSIPPGELAQGGPDGVLDRQMVGLLAITGGLQPGGKVPEATKISLGPHQGREYRLTGRGAQGPPTPIYIRVYVIRNLMVVLMGPARGNAPAPETVAFFNSLKLGLDRAPPSVLLKGTLSRDDPFDSFGLTQNSFHKVHLVPLEPGKPYMIDVEGDFDTILRIEDADKKMLLLNDDVCDPFNLNSRVVFTPSKKATYRLIVTSAQPQATGSYTLAVRDAVKVGDATVIKDRLEKKEPAPQGGKFSKLHRIELVEGSPYTLELTSPNFDATIVLPSAAGTPPAQASASPGNPARLDFTPPRAGVYQIVVTSARPEQTGEYTLSVQRYEEATKAKGP